MDSKDENVVLSLVLIDEHIARTFCKYKGRPEALSTVLSIS